MQNMHHEPFCYFYDLCRRGSLFGDPSHSYPMSSDYRIIRDVNYFEGAKFDMPQNKIKNFYSLSSSNVFSLSRSG